MEDNIILIGFMGSGKTTVGRELSQILNLPFIDTDLLIEEREGMMIRDIFRQKGEKYFRDLERKAVADVLIRKGQIISTGGGAVMNSELFSLMKDSGRVVALMANVDTLWKRLKKDKDRPLLMVDNPKGEIESLYLKRRPVYLKAHHIIWVDNKNPGAIAREILEKALPIDQLKQE